MKLRGVEVDLGRYRVFVPLFFLLGVVGTYELLLWEDRDEFAQHAPRSEGVVSRITYFDRSGRRKACRLHLHSGDGDVEDVTDYSQSCDELRPDRIVGEEFRILRLRTGRQAEVVIGGEVIERYESVRRIINASLGFIIWSPFLASLLNLSGYLYRTLKAAESDGKPGFR